MAQTLSGVNSDFTPLLLLGYYLFNLLDSSLNDMTEPTDPKESPWIRVSTAAALKGIARQNIYWHIEQGNLRTKTIDGMMFVSRASVEALEITSHFKRPPVKKKTAPKKKSSE